MITESVSFKAKVLQLVHDLGPVRSADVSEYLNVHSSKSTQALHKLSVTEDVCRTLVKREDNYGHGRRRQYLYYPPLPGEDLKSKVHRAIEKSEYQLTSKQIGNIFPGRHSGHVIRHVTDLFTAGVLDRYKTIVNGKSEWVWHIKGDKPSYPVWEEHEDLDEPTDMPTTPTETTNFVDRMFPPGNEVKTIESLTDKELLEKIDRMTALMGTTADVMRKLVKEAAKRTKQYSTVELLSMLMERANKDEKLV